MTTTPSRPGKTPATVAFVGAGPGDPGLLTVRAVELLAEADAVVIDQIARDQVVARHCRPEVDVVDAGRGDHGQRLTHAANAKLVVSTARAHKGGLVVRLMDGDPATFNGLAEEALACAKAGVPVEVVPGVSAVSAVPAYAGVPLTTAESSAVHVIAHAGGTKGRASTVDPACLDPRSTVVVLGSAEALAAGLAALLEAGRDAGTPVAVTGHGTSVRQSTAVTTLEDATAAVESAPTPALAVVGPTVDLRQTINWFESRPLFGWNVLVPRTKEQSESIDRRLSRYGAISTVVPTISVEPPRTPQQMERAITGLVTGRYEWVGFTSVNAVKAVRERFEALGLDVRSFAGLKVAAVGGVTAQALRDWGLIPDLVPTGEQSARGRQDDQHEEQSRQGEVTGERNVSDAEWDGPGQYRAECDDARVAPGKATGTRPFDPDAVHHRPGASQGLDIGGEPVPPGPVLLPRRAGAAFGHAERVREHAAGAEFEVFDFAGRRNAVVGGAGDG